MWAAHCVGGSAWGKNVQFFCSGHSIPALVDAELSIQVDCVAFGGRLGNIECV